MSPSGWALTGALALGLETLPWLYLLGLRVWVGGCVEADEATLGASVTVLFLVTAVGLWRRSSRLLVPWLAVTGLLGACGVVFLALATRGFFSLLYSPAYRFHFLENAREQGLLQGLGYQLQKGLAPWSCFALLCVCRAGIFAVAFRVHCAFQGDEAESKNRILGQV